MTDTKFGFGTPLVYFPELEGKIKDKYLTLHNPSKQELEDINNEKRVCLVEKIIEEDNKKFKIQLVVRYLK